MTLNTAELGSLAELRFQQRCVERGILCCAPAVACQQSIDFVIRFYGEWRSVQVKKASVRQHPTWKNPRIKASLHNKKRAKAIAKATDREIVTPDYYAFVCSELNSIWLVPFTAVPSEAWTHDPERLNELDRYLF